MTMRRSAHEPDELTIREYFPAWAAARDAAAAEARAQAEANRLAYEAAQQQALQGHLDRYIDLQAMTAAATLRTPEPEVEALTPRERAARVQAEIAAEHAKLRAQWGLR